MDHLLLFQLTEQMIGYTLLIVSFALIFRTCFWLELLESLQQLSEKTTRQIGLFTATIVIPLGLFIVLTHNRWEWSPSVIVTSIGWSVLIKNSLILFFPKFIRLHLLISQQSRLFQLWFFRGVGMLYLICALAVLKSYWS